MTAYARSVCDSGSKVQEELNSSYLILDRAAKLLEQRYKIQSNQASLNPTHPSI